MVRQLDGRPVRRAHPIHCVGQVLGEILHLELRLRAFGRDAVAEHRKAEGTGGRHPRRLSPQRLLDARMVDARPDLLLHPHAAAARPAAEPALVMALDLDQLGTRDGLDDRAWRIVDVVPAAEVAGIVVREFPIDRLVRPQPAPLMKPASNWVWWTTS